MNKRQLLFQAAGPTGPAKVSAEIARLEAIYLKTYKRKLPIDLFFSDMGTKTEPLYGLTAYFEPHQTEDVRFLISQTQDSPC